MKRAFIILTLIGAALTGGAQAQERVSVVALRSVAEPFVDTLLLRGRTEAKRRVDVRAEVAGLVISEPISKGTLVSRGDVLCEVRDGDRTAELSEATARLKEAEIEFNAADKLVERGFTSEMAASAKSAALEAAKARVLRAEMNVDRLTIRAPFDGVLETNTAELGSLLQNGSVCASLITLDPIKLVAFAPERSVDALEVGADVRGRLITGREVEGRITYVARSADRDTRTYLVEAEVPNPKLEIRDGMTAEMRIVLEGKPAHRLPQTALTLNSEGAIGVRLSVDDVSRFAPVEILRDEPEGVWVAGLDDVAEVIVVGQEFVTDGQLLDVNHLAAGVTQ